MRKPHYYKGAQNIEKRLEELRSIAEQEEADEINNKLTTLRTWQKQGYAPMMLVRLGPAGIRYEVEEAKAFLVHQERVYAYDTQRYGKAYEHIDWVMCKPINVRDADGRNVYELPDGKKFVVEEWPGSPEAFGGLNVIRPRITRPRRTEK